MARNPIHSINPTGRTQRIDENFVDLYNVFGTDAGTGAIATDATAGFLYLPSCAGPPTGTPVGITGRVAVVYDSTNNKLYVYNGAWRSTAALT
jgi:hypothetical protein